MHQLGVGVEQPLSVVAQPSVLLPPHKAALDHAAPGNHHKFMHFASLGDCGGPVFLRALYSKDLIASNCSRLVSLGSRFLMPTDSDGIQRLSTGSKPPAGELYRQHAQVSAKLL